jgi:hypothetical protein
MRLSERFSSFRRVKDVFKVLPLLILVLLNGIEIIFRTILSFFAQRHLRTRLTLDFARFLLSLIDVLNHVHYLSLFSLVGHLATSSINILSFFGLVVITSKAKWLFWRTWLGKWLFEIKLIFSLNWYSVIGRGLPSYSIGVIFRFIWPHIQLVLSPWFLPRLLIIVWKRLVWVSIRLACLRERNSLRPLS